MLQFWSHAHHKAHINSIDFHAIKRPINIEGVIAAPPDIRPLHIKYTVAVDTLHDAWGATQRGIYGNVLVNASVFSKTHEIPPKTDVVSDRKNREFARQSAL